MHALFAALGSSICGQGVIGVPYGGSRRIDGAHFLGYNVVNLQSGNFSDQDYATSTSALQPGGGILRYPGGNLADFWDWKKGWCVPNTTIAGCPQLNNPCTGKKVRQYLLEEFKLAVDKSGSQVVMMVNMLTARVQDQIVMLKAADEMGVMKRGSYVELGGEFYWGKFQGRWSTGADYAKEANEWAQTITAAFSSSSSWPWKLMAVAGHCEVDQDPQDRGFLWNEQVYAGVGPLISGVTIHPYLHLGDEQKGGGQLQPLVPGLAKGGRSTVWFDNATVQEANFALLHSEAGMEALLGVPFFVADIAAGNLATHVALPARLRMVITEFNVMERAGPMKLSWAHALFVAATSFALLSSAQIDAVLLHVLLDGFGWGALYESNADFSGPHPVGQPQPIPPAGSVYTATGKVGCLLTECTALKTKAYAITAVGSALQALSTAMQTATVATRLNLGAGTPSNPMLHGRLPTDLPGVNIYPSLTGWQFSASNATAVAASASVTNTNVTIVNLSAKPLRFNHSSAERCRSYSVLSSPDPTGNPMAWATEDSPVRVQHGNCGSVPDANAGNKQGSLDLPPYSIMSMQM